MNDAALPPGDAASCIGYVQVGLNAGIDPVWALPALVQCGVDALGRFGQEVTLTGLEVVIHDLVLAPAGDEEFEGLCRVQNWFHVADPSWPQVHIAMDQALLAQDKLPLLADWLLRYGRFEPEMGGLTCETSVVTLPPAHRIRGKVPHQVLTPAAQGLALRLPAWTASAAVWALAVLFAVVREEFTPLRRVQARRCCALRKTRVA